MTDTARTEDREDDDRKLIANALRNYTDTDLDETEHARELADSVEQGRIEWLFGQTAESIRETWTERETQIRREGIDLAEVYPRGAEPEGALVRWMLEHGLIWLCNRIGIHPFGVAIGVDKNTPQLAADNDAPACSFFAMRTTDPEGFEMSPLDDEIGAGRIPDLWLDVIITRLREIDGLLTAEQARRSDFTRRKTNPEIDEAVVNTAADLITQFASGVSYFARGTIASMLGLTRAQMSASILRLTAAGVIEPHAIDGETVYDLTDPAKDMDKDKLATAVRSGYTTA